jgi:hypothetical protein
MLEANAAACAEAHLEVRTEFGGATVGVLRVDGLAEVSVRREGFHDCCCVPISERRLVSANDITRVGQAGREDRSSHVAPAAYRLLAKVRAEHHRPIVGGLGYDRHRPGDFLSIYGQVRHQLYNGPITFDCGGDRLATSLVFRQHGSTVPYEMPKTPVASDLAGVGVVDNHLTWPNVLQVVRIAAVQRNEVLPDRICLTGGAILPAH